MTFGDAESKAARAKRSAGQARGHASSSYEREMAEAVEELSKAVQYMADQMRRDQR